MSSVRFVDYKAVKQAVSIVQVLDRYNLTEQLRRNGDSFSGVCPIHNGSNPTQFRVSISKNCWNCFGQCKRGGNVIDFVSLKEKISFREAALLLQDWFKILEPPASEGATEKPPVEKSAAASAGRHDSPPKPEGSIQENKPLGFELKHLDVTHPYLSERGLSQKTIRNFGIGFCSKGSMANRIAIPIQNQKAETVAYGGRWIGDPPAGTSKYKLPKAFLKSHELFNCHRAEAAERDHPLIVVEGFFDCMRVWQAGYPRVAALMGSSISDAQAELILSLANPDGKVALMFDQDEAGRKGREGALQKLVHHAFVRVIDLAKEGLQPDMLSNDEIRQAIGGDEIERDGALHEARIPYRFLISTGRDWREDSSPIAISA